MSTEHTPTSLIVQPHVSVIVEVAPLTILEDRLVVALEPGEGTEVPHFFEGGIRAGQDYGLDDVARRLLRSNGTAPRYLEQVIAKAGPGAESNELWQLRVVYMALHEVEDLLSLERTGRAMLVPVAPDMPELAPSARSSLADVLIRLQAKAEFTTLVANFLPEEFTLAQLQGAYEVVLGKGMNSANFRRKILDLGALEERGIHQGIGRPARLYRLANRRVSFKRQMS